MMIDSVRPGLERHALISEEIHAIVGRLDRNLSVLASELDAVHTGGSPWVATNDDRWVGVKDHFKALSQLLLVETDGAALALYYRYHDRWSRHLQQTCFLIAFEHFLMLLPRRHSDGISTDILVIEQLFCSPEQVERIIGVPVHLSSTEPPPNVFHVPIEDFLHGQVSLCNELSRLAVTSVINGNYGLPALISRFLCKIHSGFQLLNLKNDSLRRRFDSLKYDIKRCEEVVYQIKLRRLLNDQ